MMRKNYFDATVLIVSAICYLGCTSTKFLELGENELDAPNTRTIHTLASGKIVSIEQDDDITMQYDREGAKFKTSYSGQDSVVVGLDAQGALSITPLKQIRRIWIEDNEIDAVSTILVVGGFTITVVYIALLISLYDVYD